MQLDQLFDASDGKESAHSSGDPVLIPGLERSLGEGIYFEYNKN